MSLDSHKVVNMSRFLQKFEHCNGEDSIKLHNYLKQFKLNIRYLGINPNSNRVVVVLVSFFIGKLGD